MTEVSPVAAILGRVLFSLYEKTVGRFQIERQEKGQSVQAAVFHFDLRHGDVAAVEVAVFGYINSDGAWVRFIGHDDTTSTWHYLGSHNSGFVARDKLSEVISHLSDEDALLGIHMDIFDKTPMRVEEHDIEDVTELPYKTQQDYQRFADVWMTATTTTTA